MYSSPRLEYRFMVEIASPAPAVEPELVSALVAAQQMPVTQSSNGICYAASGPAVLVEGTMTAADLERLVGAVPSTMAAALARRAYYFVPLALGEGEEVQIASASTTELAERAACHRNAKLANAEVTFLSTRLMHDRFAMAFEFFINIGHHFVEAAGVPESFQELVLSQARAEVRGETSQDAWEGRRRAFPKAGSEEARVEARSDANPGDKTDAKAGEGDRAGEDEQAKHTYLATAFADALAIYMLSLTVDFDYADLREREYPLLASPALAERLRMVASLLPPNTGYEFEIRYRRRSDR